MITLHIESSRRKLVKQTASTRAFSSTDLLVALVVTSVVAVAYLTGSLTDYSRRVSCRSNLRQIAGALQMYAGDYNGLLPDCSAANPAFAGRTWPWDLNTNLIGDLDARRVGRNTLYCPANPAMNDSQHWDFWENDPNHSVRILGYCFLLNGIEDMPEQFRCTNLRGNLDKSSADTELVTDAVDCISSLGSIRDPQQRSMDDDYVNSQGLWKGRTSHLRGLIKGIRPAGGNIAFEDGHVAWRDFYQMQHRFNTGNIAWDF